MEGLTTEDFERFVHQVIDDICGRRAKGVDVKLFAAKARIDEVELRNELEKLKDFLIICGSSVKDKNAVTVTTDAEKQALIYSMIEIRRPELKEGLVSFIKRNSNEPFLLDFDWKASRTVSSWGTNTTMASFIFKSNGGPSSDATAITLDVSRNKLDEVIESLTQIRDDARNWTTDVPVE